MYQNLGRRIVMAARMATAMHLEFSLPRQITVESGTRRTQQRDGIHGSDAGDFTEEVLQAVVLAESEAE